MKKIVLTGGGTAGHVTPNLALLPSLKERGYEIHYIGSYNGIERKLIEGAGIPYDGISSGKLRRYFDLKNFSDPFRVIKGYAEARRLLKKYRPDVVFSKGGFVSVPVVLAAKHFKIPAIIHESDMTPGLANKICIPSAAKVCCNFPETLPYLPEEKAVLTGSPIRRELLEGDRLTGLQYAGLSAEKPVILVIGGSLGAVAVNNAVRSILPKLLETYQPMPNLSQDTSEWLSILERSGSGYVTLIRVGDVQMSGIEFRELLGLRSSDFDFSFDGETFTFTTIGYGHGVGLSQYGADYLARQGKTYQEILEHYYSGATLVERV